MTKVCPCGTPFYVQRHRAERSKFCSKPCRYRYATRRSGLTYTIVSTNAGWFRPGERPSPDTEFKPGAVPHNYKGDEAGYDSLHDWVKRRAGRADEHLCERCGHDGSIHPLSWANKSHEYRRDLDDWMVLCSTCHVEYDRSTDWGAAARLFQRRPDGGSYGVRR